VPVRFSAHSASFQRVAKTVCIFCALLFSGCQSVAERKVVSNSETSDFNNLSLVTSDSDIAGIIEEEEKANEIPSGLLKAIAEVESGCNPYFVNVHKRSLRFQSKDEALKFVEQQVVRKKQYNLSIGCLQLHYRSHRKNFLTIDSMLEPRSNIKYAAKLLKSLYNRYGNWERAVKCYHAANSRYNIPYFKKVMRRYGKSL
jgi:soluble lytic murein transglycosylase-like protein